jgi:glycosyltransferase involved in cell wall biosynthesis
MPTANRSDFVPLAIARFLRQDYPRKELVIVDDGQASVEHLVPDHADIFYHRHPGGITLGEKRNWAVRQTRGNIILHWDDDDWSAPDWITLQVQHLLETEADVTGMEEVYFLDPAAEKAWKYMYPKDLPRWVCGATLCYRRKLWEINPFPPVNVGEDSQFLWSEVPKKVIPHGEIRRYVALIHLTNTSAKDPQLPRWKAEDAEMVIALMGKGYGEMRNAVLRRGQR